MSGLVSIIIPAYNVERYIGQCISSVIHQTYNNIEVIVINDGSKDQTIDIINKYQKLDRRIIVVNQENRGLSATRNTGLHICKGDYIFFLDSDDWIELNCIETLVSLSRKNNADIVFFDYFKNFEHKEVEHHVYKKDFNYNINQNNKTILWDMRTITAWGKLYSRKSVEGILFDEKMKIAEDVDFNFRVYKKIRAAFFTSNCLLHYRILEKSAVHGYDINVKTKFEYPLNKIASYMKNGNIEDMKAYYSFVSIAYILICQNGVVRNNTISVSEKIKQIKAISKEKWMQDLIDNIQFVSIPMSRKVLIYLAKFKIYFTMIIAANIRRRLKR